MFNFKNNTYRTLSSESCCLNLSVLVMSSLSSGWLMRKCMEYWTHFILILILISLNLPRKAVHNCLWLTAKFESFSENIRANKDTEPNRSSSSVLFSLNSSYLKRKILNNNESMYLISFQWLIKKLSYIHINF